MTLNATRAIVEGIINSGLTVCPIAWPSIPYNPQPNISYFGVRTSITSNKRITIGAPQWRQSGMLTVQCFAVMSPEVDTPYFGQAGALEMADIVSALFQGEVTSGIRWDDIDIVDFGADGQFYQVNVAIQFTNDVFLAQGTA